VWFERIAASNKLRSPGLRPEFKLPNGLLEKTLKTVLSTGDVFTSLVLVRTCNSNKNCKNEIAQKYRKVAHVTSIWSARKRGLANVGRALSCSLQFTLGYSVTTRRDKTSSTRSATSR